MRPIKVARHGSSEEIARFNLPEVVSAEAAEEVLGPLNEDGSRGNPRAMPVEREIAVAAATGAQLAINHVLATSGIGSTAWYEFEVGTSEFGACHLAFRFTVAP